MKSFYAISFIIIFLIIKCSTVETESYKEVKEPNKTINENEIKLNLAVEKMINLLPEMSDREILRFYYLFTDSERELSAKSDSLYNIRIRTKPFKDFKRMLLIEVKVRKMLPESSIKNKSQIDIDDIPFIIEDILWYYGIIQ